MMVPLLANIGKVGHGSVDDEIELIKRIQNRDTDALAELYDLYNRLLFGMIISTVKKREEAEAILQKVFLKIWNNAGSFNPKQDNVFNWIVTMTRNEAIENVRQTKTYSSDTDHHDPLRSTIFSDRSELVKKALHQISEEQRELIKLAYYRGMTQSQIADHLDIRLETIKNRIRDGMIKLNNILVEFISN